MKLLVFAHVPPPHHGQRQMVQYLVDGLRAQPELGIEVFHVDARFSDGLQDVGAARGGKVFQLFRYCAQALRLRRRHGVRTLYYVPSPPARTPLIRDWMVFALLRPWFRRRMYHWEAAGLGEWLETTASAWERLGSRCLLAGPDLSIVLAESNRRDAEVLRSRRTAVVPNAIEDPCPEFENTLGPARRARLDPLRSRGGIVRALFLALNSRDKGLFDALDAVALANAVGGSELRFHLTVAGAFPEPALETEFRDRCGRADLEGAVTHVGFVSGAAKAAAWRDTDVFLFPTYYANEGQPVGLIEAMAYGVPAVTTRWRGIPEMLPEGYPGLVSPRDPNALAERLRVLALSDEGFALRRRFLAQFTLERYLSRMAQAIRSVEPEALGTAPA
ncbi:MAG: glycosyltransferase family 4 protein [Verrucomicrobiae bacterium]|nr:glycosyltransferase family 4 protein [Verrucomicrobiae bacterium]